MLPKLQATSQQRAEILFKSVNRTRSSPKLDAKTLRSLCFRKKQFSEDELEMLFNARAEWDEFDRAFPLAEEFLKIIRRQG